MAAAGVGVGFAALVIFMNVERTSDIPKNSQGMIPGTMAHLRVVKLTAVAKLPDYAVNNDDVQRADMETALAIVRYSSHSQLEILMGSSP